MSSPTIVVALAYSMLRTDLWNSVVEQLEDSLTYTFTSDSELAKKIGYNYLCQRDAEGYVDTPLHNHSVSECLKEELGGDHILVVMINTVSSFYNQHKDSDNPPWGGSDSFISAYLREEGFNRINRVTKVIKYI